MILLLAVLAMPADPPSAEQLIHAAIAARKAQDDRGWKFTFREDQEQDGKVRTFDNIMLEGENYRQLMLIDGKPLPPKIQEQVDKDLEHAREERRHRKGMSITRSVSFADLDKLEALYDNKVTGSEMVNGRDAWRMESAPKAKYKPTSKEEKEALAARHVTWFDKEEGVELKEQIVFMKAMNGFQLGSEIDTVYNKFSDTWLAEYLTMHIDFKAMMVVHAKGETKYHYYDYKRFTVESKITTP